MNILKSLFTLSEFLVSKDAEQLERIAEYYANNDMTEDEIKQAIAQLIPQNEMRINGKTKGSAPLDYKNITLSNKQPSVIPDKKTAKKIKELFKQFLTGNCSMQTLVDITNDMRLHS